MSFWRWLVTRATARSDDPDIEIARQQVEEYQERVERIVQRARRVIRDV